MGGQLAAAPKLIAGFPPHPAPQPTRSTFCTLDAHPKDAEELVQEACKEAGVAPNATTLRTLDRIWQMHEQLRT